MKNYNIQRIFFEIYYLDLFIFIIVNAIIAAQLGYTLCDWSVFFVNNSLKKPQQKFLQKKYRLKISQESSVKGYIYFWISCIKRKI